MKMSTMLGLAGSLAATARSRPETTASAVNSVRTRGRFMVLSLRDAEQMLFAADQEAIRSRQRHRGADDRFAHDILRQQFKLVARDVRYEHRAVLARGVELAAGHERRGVKVRAVLREGT